MGYYISVQEVKFYIPKENIQGAYEAIKALHGKETRGDHFAWVSHEFYKLPDFKSIIEDWGWSVEFDSEGNINNLSFDREKIGDEQILFDAIAPFVKEGSFIHIVGEEAEQWKWVFKNNKCVEIQPKVVWED